MERCRMKNMSDSSKLTTADETLDIVTADEKKIGNIITEEQAARLKKYWEDSFRSRSISRRAGQGLSRIWYNILNLL